MPTNNPRITFTVSDDLLREIEDFRFDKRIKNQTQAIITLINMGFETLGDKEEEPPLYTEDELLLIAEYRAAPQGIKEAAHNILFPYLERPEKSRA